MAYVLLAIVVLVIVGIWRCSGTIARWLYDVLHDFFNEALRGNRYRKSLAKLLAGIGMVVVIILLIEIL